MTSQSSHKLVEGHPSCPRHPTLQKCGNFRGNWCHQVCSGGYLIELVELTCDQKWRVWTRLGELHKKKWGKQQLQPFNLHVVVLASVFTAVFVLWPAASARQQRSLSSILDRLGQPKESCQDEEPLLNSVRRLQPQDCEPPGGSEMDIRLL